MTPTSTQAHLAAAARSILSCPASVDLTVDGVAHPLADDPRLALHDGGGVPTLLCSPEGALAYAARAGRHVLLALRSGLPAAPGGWDALTLAGSLRGVGREACACCEDVLERVVVDVTLVLLSRIVDGAPVDRCRVPLAEFRSPAHHLNDGYLRRCSEHAHLAHQDDLRRAVAARTGRRLSEVIGAQLVGLTAAGARLEWVDVDGAHRTTLAFPRDARSPEELADLLRTLLHPGPC